MKRLTHIMFTPAALAALTVLAGCLEYTPLYKVGATTQETNVTRAQCNTLAANTVPPMIIQDWVPIYGANGRVIGHRIEVYDANEGRRHSTVQKCMEQQGFSRVSIPYCSDDQIAGRSFRPLTKSPQLTESICAIRQPDRGRVLIDLNQPVS